MFKLTTTFRVEWGETDTAGIIFYPNYYRWFDRVAHQLLVDAGLPGRELTRQGYVQPILECGARFHKPLIYHDLVELNAEITEIKNKTFRIEYRIKRGDTVVAEGFEVRAWAKQPECGMREEMSATPIPQEYATLLRQDGEK